MSTTSAATCERCAKSAVYGYEPACRACGYPETKRAPNVLIAADQRGALLERYARARRHAHGGDRGNAMDRLEQMAEDSRPVTNMPLGFAFWFLARDDQFYRAYAPLVESGVRAPASLEDDRRRRVVDFGLYGTYGQAISFASLSPDGRGLAAYGDVHVELDPAAIDFRTTVLEEDSFLFRRKHGDAFPPGYLAAWRDRAKLAAAKCAGELDPTLSDAQLAALIQDGTGSRATDRFLELHIYGKFNRDAVAAVRVPATCATPEDEALCMALRASIQPGIEVEGI